MANLHRLYLDKKKVKRCFFLFGVCVCVYVHLTCYREFICRPEVAAKWRNKPISLFLSVFYIKKPIRERYDNGS